jgi:riboflavin synthase
MFTGIITHVGTILEAKPLQDGKRLVVDCGAWDIADVGLGDSIMHNGCCLTVVAIAGNRLSYDVSAHTLELTTGLAQNGLVNLEKSLRLADRLGGHLVTGHVDCVGRVTQWRNIAESWFLEVEVPAAQSRYIARKGSVCVNGVSLTVNAVEGTKFQCNIIPHTFENTAFKTMREGDGVNIEVDLMARYAERMLSSPQ